jgi:signal transduction histidine kinase
MIDFPPQTGAVDPAVSPMRGVVTAMAAVGSALALRMLLRPIIGSASPFLLFTPAVAISAIYGGMVPGAIATALSAFVGSRFLLLHAAEPVVERWDRVVLFVLVGIVITGSSTLLRRSRQQLKASLWREQRARAQAEAADRAKDDFLAVVSHELRTPMGVVIGWIATLRHRSSHPDSFGPALEAIERNARVLNRLVDDILDRSRIATGTLTVNRQPISLNRVVRAAVDQTTERAAAMGIDLRLQLPAANLTVIGDAIRLQQVFTNLLTNAVKFTPKGGRVSVCMAASEGEVTISVSDTGAGISSDFLPHVFEAFRRAGQTRSQPPEGLGLGLAIARYLIEQHEGWIEARSPGEGRGSTFTVTLPLASNRNLDVIDHALENPSPSRL